ncbi:DHH family phosphoesterase, partial [Faecalibaculum rodentium]
MSESVRVTPEMLLPLACKILGRLEPDQSRWMTWLETPELHSPSQADAVVQAAARLKQAAASHEKVIVAGDYDADGILGTAILTGALRRQGIETGFYIPDRIREGYGLQEKTVRLAHEKGYSLLVTVDNGVRAEEALACAADLGMD